jgi:hypothetical protein
MGKTRVGYVGVECVFRPLVLLGHSIKVHTREVTCVGLRINCCPILSKIGMRE